MTRGDNADDPRRVAAATAPCDNRDQKQRDRTELQNRQRIEPGVSSAVPTAVAVRGLTS